MSTTTQIITMSSKGQVTIPSGIRSELGLSTGAKMLARRDESGRIILRPMKYDLEDLFGIIPDLKGREGVDFDTLIYEAQLAGIDRIMGLEDDEE